MLAPAEIFKGIEFIRISKLPVNQQEKIKKSLTHNQIIKILMDSIIIHDCVQYHAYKAWYVATYPAKNAPVSVPPKTNGPLTVIATPVTSE